MHIAPLSTALGAEILGLDLADEISNQAASDIHAAFLAHRVLFFRDQNLSPPAFVQFARLFGEPDIYPFIKGLPGTPEVIEIIKTEDDTKNFGGSWHSDTSYMDCPALGTTLYALETPTFGGDTLFANGYLAYETLSDGLKATLDQLIGVYSSHKGRVVDTRAARVADAPKEDAKTARVAEHPIIRIHPETKRKSLYVSFAHTTHFKGWTEAESKPLLDYLFEHQTRPEFTCRFRWEPGSIALWDNRCALHNPINDYHGHKRVLHRITFAGDAPAR
jgi:taurine dioxygenase